MIRLRIGIIGEPLTVLLNSLISVEDVDHQGPDFDDMSSFFPREIDDAIQSINLGFGAQVLKNSYFIVHFSSFCVVFKLLLIFVILASYFQGLLHLCVFFSSFTELSSFSTLIFKIIILLW